MNNMFHRIHTCRCCCCLVVEFPCLYFFPIASSSSATRERGTERLRCANKRAVDNEGRGAIGNACRACGKDAAMKQKRRWGNGRGL